MKQTITISLVFLLVFNSFFGLAQDAEQADMPENRQNAASEIIEQVFAAGVNALGSVLFWDPFEFLGITDPRVRDDKGNLVFNLEGYHKANYKTAEITYFFGDDNQKITKSQVVVYNDAGEVVVASTDDPIFGVDGQQVTDPDKAFVRKEGIPFVVIWLVLGAVFFTLKMRFVNFWGFKHAIELIAGKFDDPNDKGEVSHFQALATALSGTVGLGNIAGVAVAISTGGPGATFWMIIAGLLGMTSKFVECTLGVKYRTINKNGVVFGGPMYYLSRGLHLKGLTTLGTVLSVLFAILCIGGSFGGGNMFQANQAYQQLKEQLPFLGGEYMNFIFGLGLATVVGIVIIGGIKSIAKVTDKIVPLMAVTYVISALVILIINYDQIGYAFVKIFEGAFSADAAFGGFLGVLIQGFRRAAFSNEAGIGSASIAHSAAKTNEPVSEGIVALLEPFIDTVVICTCTALVIIISQQYMSMGVDGTTLTSAAFAQTISWFPIVLSFSVLLFAFSTMISWSYYGLNAWAFLFGRSHYTLLSYKIIFLLMIIVGTTVKLGAVIDFSDMMILGMAFPNILGLLLLSSEVRKDLISYFHRISTGEIKKFK